MGNLHAVVHAITLQLWLANRVIRGKARPNNLFYQDLPYLLSRRGSHNRLMTLFRALQILEVVVRKPASRPGLPSKIAVHETHSDFRLPRLTAVQCLTNRQRRYRLATMSPGATHCKLWECLILQPRNLLQLLAPS